MQQIFSPVNIENKSCVYRESWSKSKKSNLNFKNRNFFKFFNAMICFPTLFQTLYSKQFSLLSDLDLLYRVDPKVLKQTFHYICSKQAVCRLTAAKTFRLRANTEMTPNFLHLGDCWRQVQRRFSETATLLASFYTSETVDAKFSNGLVKLQHY